MHRFRIASWLVLFALALPSLPSLAASSPDFVALAKELKPSVVNISTSKTVRPRTQIAPGPRGPQSDPFEEFFERFFRGQPQVPHKERSLGSGFIISKEGYILTNDHVVSGADDIKVKLSDGRTFTASVKGLDPKLDLALLKIDTGEALPVAKLGDSDQLQIGEWVMAIGNPFGLEQTVTVGIVSAKGRVIGAGPYDDFIQTDASINPGNSGGPLFNTRGEVVGINTAIVAGGQGIGFATPIRSAQEILPQLRETGKVVRGWLGVTVQPMTEELAKSFGLSETKGALVSEVVAGSPAEKAGFKRGDIILAFDGRDVDAVNDLPRLVATTPIGKKVKVTVYRDGKTRQLDAEVGRLEEAGSEQVAAGEKGGTLGLSVSDVTPELMRAYGLEKVQGVVVTAIDPAGPGAEANLRPGDVILEVNGKTIAGVKDFRTAVKGAKKGDVLRLLVQRREGLFYMTLKAG